MRKLEQLPISHTGRQVFARYVVGTAVEGLNCDVSGRFVVPGYLRELGELNEDVQVCPMGNWIEVKDYAEFKASQFEDLARLVGRQAKINEAKALMKWE
jgi:DNA-binding transcriptional regulator/RsmH inhibitor MraZ